MMHAGRHDYAKQRLGEGMDIFTPSVRLGHADRPTRSGRRHDRNEYPKVKRVVETTDTGNDHVSGRWRQTTIHRFRNGHAFLTATGLLIAGIMTAGCSSGTTSSTPDAGPGAATGSSQGSGAPTSRQTSSSQSSASQSSASSHASSPTSSAHIHVLVLKATGDATVQTLTYELDGQKKTETNVKLPWQTSLDIPPDGIKHTYSVKTKTTTGSLQIVATVDGSVWQSTSGSGGGDNSLEGSLRATK